MIYCNNSKCVHYYEDLCVEDINGKRVEINADRECETFKYGVNEGYEDGPSSELVYPDGTEI